MVDFFKKFYKEFILLIIYIGLFIPKLGYSYVQPTDPVWVQRGIQFYEAFRHADFAQTYTKYHPGVTLMWITGLSYKIFYALQKVIYGSIRDLFLYQVELYPVYSFIAKFFIVIVIMIVLSYCYIVIKKLTNTSLAFWITFFIITEPFVIGNIRSIHVDALAAFFMFAAVVSFWALQVNKFTSKKYILLTGVFTGLALLTKINSLVLFPFFVVASLMGCRSLGGDALYKFRSFLVIFLFSILVFIALFPAMWVSPVGTVQKIAMDGFLDTALNEESSRIVYLGWETSSLIYKYLSYLVQLAFRTTPVFLVLVFVGLINFQFSIFRPEADQPLVGNFQRNLKVLLLFSSIFIAGYYVMISIPDKKIFRYILPLYPFLAVFAAYGVEFLTLRVKKFITHPVCERLTRFAIFIIFGIQLFQPLSVYPNFFAYFNPLLGGIIKASKVISLNQDATGYYIVGDYLNKKPNAENLSVACYDSGPMSAYFKGHALKLKLYNPKDVFGEATSDYILLPRQEGWQYLPKEKYELERVFRINNFDYWYLFKRKP